MPGLSTLTHVLALLIAVLTWIQPAQAACDGVNLLQSLPPEDSARLDGAVARHPYATGNFWRATRGNEVLHLIGSYHADDPRHAPIMDALLPLIQSATTVLVEAGPKEEAALKTDMAADPNLILLSDGTSLLEKLGQEDWQALSLAMKARGVPALMAARFKPWYVSLLLAMPPCIGAEIAAANGLDHRIIKTAEAANVQIQALEPHETALKMFDKLNEDEQIGMIRASLQLEPQAADIATTMADGYFAQDSRRVWEYMRLQAQTMPDYTVESANAEYANMEEVLMSNRNRAWIPVIEAAVAKGPTVAAFGALHLSGKDGVLNLLEKQGFALTRLAY